MAVGGVVVMSLMQHGGGCYVICVRSEMLMMLCDDVVLVFSVSACVGFGEF